MFGFSLFSSTKIAKAKLANVKAEAARRERVRAALLGMLSHQVNDPAWTVDQHLDSVLAAGRQAGNVRAIAEAVDLSALGRLASLLEGLDP